jgi:serine/threonine protein kinase
MPFANDLTGTLLDRRYQITGVLGKGGMGHVYEAVHVALEQRVAIKVLHPRFAAEERFRERFIREARSASRIHHRNVVRISDFGDTPDGSVYFVMELLEGHDVGEELRRAGAMPWARTRHILLQAVGALRAAHAKAIIHRDIKPANCFLTVEEDIADFVKLLDFGIAKVGSDSHADARGKGLTGTGEVFGTAAYMAPEQARGNELDARSDMYSLGIMAYEMLTGHVPFTGVNAIHVITKQLSEAPAPLRRHEPTIPVEVETLVLKMIAKEASQRYASMDALEQALRSIPETVKRTQIWSSGRGASKPGSESGSGRLGAGSGQAVRGAVGVASKVEATAIVPPRVAPSGGGAGGVATAGAVVQPVHGYADRSWPPPGAVAPAIPGSRDRSVPPPGAVVQPVHGHVDQSWPPPGARDPSVPPPGAVVQPVHGHVDHSWPPPGARDPSVPPPGAVAYPVHGHADHSWPPPGAVAQQAPGRRDRSVPPPGRRDPSVPPSPAWVSGSSSTGPLARAGDSSTETSPQSLQATPPPLISGRTLALVVFLVFLVGGGSALVTMVVLTSREAQPAAPSEAEGKAAPDAEGEVPRGEVQTP